MEEFGNTTIVTVNSKPVFELCPSSQFREQNSTFAVVSSVVSSHYEASDVAMEEVDFNRREQAI